jgi:hypothetical protein
MPGWWRTPASGPRAGRGRGRVGSYYTLAASTGVALAVSIAPEGIVAESIDAHGETIARAQEKASRPARPVRVAAALRVAAEKASRDTGRAPRLAVVSAADPVDRIPGANGPPARRAVPAR